MDQLVDVSAVEVVGAYELRHSRDGLVGDIWFADHEWLGVFEPLEDRAGFAQVFADPEFGTIAWPTGVDMAPEPPCEAARAHPVVRSSARH
jgi:hypothetical protein